MSSLSKRYRGRIAPTPSGFLHLGHGRTFWIAAERVRRAGGTLVLRNEDLDPGRSRAEFVAAMFDDLRWLGIEWQEGPDVGGPFGPYTQSKRGEMFLSAWQQLHATGLIYPSPHSRKDVLGALTAPHEVGDEPVFPPSLRPPLGAGADATSPGDLNWRFRVPDERVVEFHDGRHGLVRRTTGVDFGDFLVWRRDGFPSYELAVVADDHAMEISEVVRGDDLLTSTVRQLLLYEALGWQSPGWFHCPLMTDEQGQRLAKRTAALSLRELRARGENPEHYFEQWGTLVDHVGQSLRD